MDFDVALAAVSVEVRKAAGDEPLPKGFLEDFVESKSQLSRILDEKLKQRLVRHLETLYGTVQDDGHSLRIPHQEWYGSRKPRVDFYYWRRLSTYWRQDNVLPIDVIRSVDKVTDEIIGWLGDPEEKGYWRRRGLVMGHVQSGKTTNYSAVLAKAADVGYRFLIVFAGITNSLRFQTQVRLDETLVGRASFHDQHATQLYSISRVGSHEPGWQRRVRHPTSGTTQDKDFTIQSARSVLTTEDGINEPLLFVTKKNQSVLRNLCEWLKSLKHGGRLNGPLLIIDDEADNASVNTSNRPGEVTAINSRIMDLLDCSRRSSYVGYTATPFANIFIDPDLDEDNSRENLFPADFIKSLDPPDNYIGSTRLFSDRGDLSDQCVREIPDDFRDLLPLKHKSDFDVVELPQSLREAIFEYVVLRAVRIWQGDGSKHSAMLINVSRFNRVQEGIQSLVYVLCEEIKNAVAVWGKSEQALHNPHIRTMQDIWSREFEGEHGLEDLTWAEVLRNAREAIESVEVRTVNMKGGGLDYTRAPDCGMHVIAVGGLALARGLTLEGLGISYVLRNVHAADTLMQIGRWFGYRPGYGHLCRIHLTPEMIEHFAAVSNSIEELRDDLVRMEAMGKTPNEFGLKVRQSPTGIAITAANKMRTARKLRLALDLSLRHVQGFTIPNSAEINARHYNAVQSMVKHISEDENTTFNGNDNNAIVWTGVNVRHVVDLLAQFEIPQVEFAMIRDEANMIIDYIQDRAKDELLVWDVAIPYLASDFGTKESLIPFPISGVSNAYCRRRYSAILIDGGSNVKVTRKNVVADVGANDLAYGHDRKLMVAKAEEVRSEGISLERACLEQRVRPLLVIHVFQLKIHAEESGLLLIPHDSPAISLSLGFTNTSVPSVSREYAASKRFQQLLEAQRAEMETDEEVPDD